LAFDYFDKYYYSQHHYDDFYFIDYVDWYEYYFNYDICHYQVHDYYLL